MNVQEWEKELALSADFDRAFIVDGVKHGFKIVSDNAIPVSACTKNYRSATCPANFAKTDEQVSAEVLAGNYVIPRVPPVIISALGAIPKPASQRVRLIHDCSQPQGFAVNDYADKYTFCYQSLNDATDLVQPGSWMAKVDLHSAYRSIPLHPSNYAFTGLKWHFTGDSEATTLLDTKLPFGASLAPLIFNRITQSIRRMMQRRGYEIVVYLDDFLIVESSFVKCLTALNVLLALLNRLGFYIVWGKMEGPSQRITFLGVIIDSLSLQLELPAEKLSELSSLLRSACKKRHIRKRTLQQLLGKLNWAAQVIRGGRTFLWRLIDKCSSLACLLTLCVWIVKC